LSTFSDATVPAGSWVVMITTALSGAVTELSVTITYTED